jgi:hypothetical protein
VPSTSIVNQFYVYAVDANFGPFFLKFSSYFPYTGRLCLNGHEWAKRQLEREGIAYQPLDNGFRSCPDPERLQAICDGLTPRARIEALLRKWLARLPNPYTEADRAAGYRYELSVLQAEVSLTQVFGETTFVRLTQPALVNGQRAPALRFADRRTRQLLSTLFIFRLGPAGFAARDMRSYVAPLFGLSPASSARARLSYELRRLRLHGLIERIPKRPRARRHPRREDLTLEHAEVDLDLVEPSGVDRETDGHELRVRLHETSDGGLAPIRAAVVEDPEDAPRRAVGFGDQDLLDEPAERLDAGLGLTAAEELGPVDVSGGEILKAPAAPVFMLDEHRVARSPHAQSHRSTDGSGS